MLGVYAGRVAQGIACVCVKAALHSMIALCFCNETDKHNGHIGDHV